MSKIIIRIIKLYQKTPLHLHSYCRFIPSCSNYAIIVLERFGFFKGIFLAIKRVIRCNPFGKTGIDLPPEK